MNFYEQPAQQQFIDTYAALPFQEMAMLGSAYKQEKEKTEAALDAYKAQYGDFKSMSIKDIENWDKTIGVVNPALEQMRLNPEYIKSQEGQAQIRNLIRSVDTKQLNQYRTNAANLEKRAEMVQRLKAAGKYNPEWDDIDIANWDTAKQGIMTDLAPIEYQSASELSKQYFDNLTPGHLDFVYQNGVRYRRTGNTKADLEAIAMAKENDLLATPQGQKYYEGFLKQTGGDAEKAAQKFRDMVVDVNMERTLRPKMDVDEGWLYQQREAAKAKPQPKKGTEPSMPEPDLYDFVAKSHVEKVKSQIGPDLTQYRNYIESLTTKYGKDSAIGKNAMQGLKGIDRELSKSAEDSQISQAAAMQAQQYYMQYQNTNNDQDLLKAKQFEYAAGEYKRSSQIREAKVLERAQQPVMREEFKKAAGFDIEAINDPGKFSHAGYLKGVKRVNQKLEFSLSDKTSGDILLKNDNNLQDVVTNTSGGKTKVYQYNTTSGFKLPETIFEMTMGKGGRQTKRIANAMKDDSFPLKELIESGKLQNVQFIPDNKYQRVSSNQGPQLIAKGKLRIPKEQIRNVVGTGMMPAFGVKYFSAGFTKESVNSAMKRMFDAGEIEEVVGDNNVPYYEIDIMKELPNDPEYIQTTKSLYKNTEGIGSASHEKATFGDEAERTMTTQGAS